MSRKNPADNKNREPLSLNQALYAIQEACVHVVIERDNIQKELTFALDSLGNLKEELDLSVGLLRRVQEWSQGLNPVGSQDVWQDISAFLKDREP
jgi:hypothetical protein